MAPKMAAGESTTKKDIFIKNNTLRTEYCIFVKATLLSNYSQFSQIYAYCSMIIDATKRRVL